MEFQDVIRRRRMVRQYDTDRPVPRDVVDRILQNGLRAPSAGFSQGWAFLVLDDPADVARFRDAVRPAEDPDGWFAARVEAPLLIVPHSNKDTYLDRYALPALMLLDLKRPRKSGLEVLHWVRQQDGLKRLPVVVLTSSRETADVNRAYDLGANSYLVKPVAFESLLEMVKALNLYWMILSERPEVGNHEQVL